MRRYCCPRTYFYPRPPRGGRPFDLRGLSKMVDISIHALREEGDSARTLTTTTVRNFYPRPPRGGRLGRATLCTAARDFYPRPPRGGRLDPSAETVYRGQFLSTPSARRATCARQACTTLKEFLSTPSARRATRRVVFAPGYYMISIHALREEGDPRTPRCRYSPADFYPRPPRGGRRQRAGQPPGRYNFYPRPPRGGRLRP